MSKINISMVFGFCLSLASIDVWAGAKNEVCRLLKKEQVPTAYLVDKDGNVSQGPVDFGQYIYTLNQAVDFIYIPTTYRVLIWPKRVVVGKAFVFGSFELKPTKPVCTNWMAYEVSYVTRGFPVFAPEQLPYKIDHLANFPPMEDPQYSWFTESGLVVKFSNRVIGEIVDGRN